LWPALSIAPLREAALRLDPAGSVLTPIHLFLAKRAAEEQAYAAVAPLIEKFIFYFPTSKEKDRPQPKYLCELDLNPAQYLTIASGLNVKMNTKECLEYLFLCGVIFIGLRRWEDAQEWLECAITWPSKDGGISKIQVEAYKKWLLVSVLLKGKTVPHPHGTPSAAKKVFTAMAKPYEAVAQIFETGTAARLKAEVDHGAGLWDQDRNGGLMHYILVAYQKFQIINLGQVYSKISIPEILDLTTSAITGTKLSGPPELEALIQTMIQDGLNATMSHSAGQPAVLTFDDRGESKTEAEMKVEIAQKTENIKALTEHIRQTDRQLTHEKDYITYAKKQTASQDRPKSQDQGIGGEMDWNPMEEEELMTGVF
jgi:COP9 signalosome complex subunit 3